MLSRAEATLKREFFSAQNKEWKSAIQAIRYLLHNKDPEIVELTRELLIGYHSLFRTLGGFHENRPPRYPVPYTFIEACDFVSRFVGHDILDDGDPGIGYDEEERIIGVEFVNNKATPKMGIHKEPYYHPNLEVLRQTDPKAEYLTAAKALEIHRANMERDKKYEAPCRKREPNQKFESWDKEEIERQTIAQLLNDLAADNSGYSWDG